MKEKAPRNRTLVLTDVDKAKYSKKLAVLSQKAGIQDVINKTINQDLLEVASLLPPAFVDLLVIDPPYNLNKSFNGKTFKKTSFDEYENYTRSWLGKIIHTLKPTASVYVCSDWESSLSIYKVLREFFTVRNRITWEREKGRGANANWKNCSEDIWFCTISDDYFFDAEAVKLKRKVIAPYKENGKPKDWSEEENGNFRLTSPSNLWTDISIPFWSMPENTDHPTQKPEKLLAKLILASSKPKDVVFDPFLGSGTTSVVAKKLGRQFLGVELNNEYACLAEKRLQMAESDTSIQGYSGGFFWERNTLAMQKKEPLAKAANVFQEGLFN
ncbi:MAG: site-specific DNA-methyltransferase [Acidobacteria bacterium]|jgi:site-specific DNA-methyltransferase (adenine-specific)|nr:site-specific DNA-methyltransferase [Acidobacteriota bacterium]MBA4124838.1 site-specific DNA-methyltransferase [Acidobacteriota bacterium]